MDIGDPVVIIREERPAIITEINRQWFTVEVAGEFYGCFTADELKLVESDDAGS
jgi:hypothetical protein